MRRWIAFAMLIPVLGAAAGPILAHAAAIAVETPSIDMLKLRDPFKKPDIQADAGPARTDLENFPLDKIKLIGVVTGPTHLRAMVATPDGKTHFIAERAKIGMRDGVVMKITPDEVKVREKIVNPLGQEENVDTELRLPPGM